MATEGETAHGGFRLSNLIDLVFPRWKEVAIVSVQLPDDMGKAMRYYRMWIYVSCIVIALPAIIFAGIVGWIFTSEYFRLLPLQPYDWTFIYLYIAIFVQIVPGPVIGCLGACKLNECLLWTYWCSMVLLCIGDAVIGIVWAIKFTTLNSLLYHHLLNGIHGQYGSDLEYTNMWDQLQFNEKCCGVNNGSDFVSSKWISDLRSANPLIPEKFLPNSCCQITPSESAFMINCSWNSEAYPLYKQGCYMILHNWMHKMGDILFVLGYSVIAFVRAALVFCLYSEIKHFIRKIYIRRVPRELEHADASIGSDLANFQRNDKTRNNSSSLIPPTRPRDRSMRRWSFIRGLRGFRTGPPNRTSASSSAQPARTSIASNSTLKLKSINEENTTML